jgi:hypothetical protein
MHFCPFKGQLFISDVTKQSILRVQRERVGGEYQGDAFYFFRSLPSVGFSLRFGPDSAAYVGERARGWGGGTPGLQWLSSNGKNEPL